MSSKVKYGIVTHPGSRNYGDDIQSIAAQQLLPRVDFFLDRESLHSPPSKDKIKLICNGWFMENPENWPPANNIEPLFISMHITHNHAAFVKMLDKKHYDYYKAHEPIGCRDRHTAALFKAIGINAYYSGCITLTLENKFQDSERTDEILFVDPFNKNLDPEFRSKLEERLIPGSIKEKAVFIEHSHKNPHDSLGERMKYAESLLDRYAKAHLVVTSRIHVALPCIALGTPVLFMDVAFNLKNSRNRFNGVIEYFNKMDNSLFPYTGIKIQDLIYRRLNLHKIYYNTSNINFNWDNPPKNPETFHPIKENIKSIVRSFLGD